MSTSGKKRLETLCSYTALALLSLTLVGSCKRQSATDDFATFKSRYAAHAFLPGDTAAIVATVVADSLQVPWEILWSPDGWLWYTEQKGSVSRLHPETGEKQVLLQLEDLVYQKSRGLFSMALHPEFDSEPFVYLCYTYQLPDTATNTKVVRYTYKENRLAEPVPLLQHIPGATYHNGSRLLITPDHKLLITTGDAGNMANSQNTQSLSGKILRINLDGSIPNDNPIPGNTVWSWGHRNPQGLVQAESGKLYISDHGADNDDEVNLVKKGGNYGWPDVMGYCDLASEKAYCADSAIVEPLLAWSPVIAPSGLDYYNHTAVPEWKNSLIVGSLKNQTLRVLHLNQNGDGIEQEEALFPEVFGRIRAVCVSPSGDVYFSTSNRDWHPHSFAALYNNFPRGNDDSIIRLSKAGPQQLAWLKTLPPPQEEVRKVAKAEAIAEAEVAPGAVLYGQYCAGCHQRDGQGVEGIYPPLAGSEWVLEDTGRLLHVMLQGLYGPVAVKGKPYDQQMPAFRFLSDEQLAEVLTYIRQNFGNKAAPIEAAEIARKRATL